MSITKSELVEILKSKGLEFGEETVKSLIEAMFEIVETIVEKTDNTLDDMAYSYVANYKDTLLELADKINSDDNEDE